MLKKLIMCVLLGVSLVDIGLGIYVNILPRLYLMLFILIELQLDLLVVCLIKAKKRVLNVIGKILGIILIIVFTCLALVLFKVQDIVNQVTKVDSEVSSYSLVVLASSDYYSISDVIGKGLGILDTEKKDYNRAYQDLQVKGTFDVKKFKNEYELAMGLLEKNVEVILLNEAYVGILDEGIDGFSDVVRVLGDARVDVEVEAGEEEQAVDEGVSLNSDEVFNVYISGIDTYGSISRVSRSDVNIIATVNLRTGDILLTNVPRDMYVQLAGKEGLKDKLTHAGVYGINTSVRTLENFLDIDISYYVRINFSSLIRVVDYIGGIDVYSEYSFKAGNRYYKSGMNYGLSGEEALAFSRNRYAFSDGDRQRGRNQEQVIAAIIDKVSEIRDIGVFYNLVNTLQSSFQTDMSKETINGLISRQLEYSYDWNVMFSDVNGYDSSNYTYSYPWQKLYVMEVDVSSLNEAKDKINSVLEAN